MFKEESRQSIHILFFLFAFLFKYTSKFQAVILLLALLLITVFIVPKLRARKFIYRQFERRYSQGAIIYFSTLLILTLIFDLYVVAASWAILALGDGMATLVGKNFKAQGLPWNKDKSYYGSLAFILFATLGAAVLLKWILPDISFSQSLSIGFKAALIGAVIESFHWRLSDNATVPIASAVVISFLL